MRVWALCQSEWYWRPNQLRHLLASSVRECYESASIRKMGSIADAVTCMTLHVESGGKYLVRVIN